MKGWTPRLALRKRLRVMWKWLKNIKTERLKDIGKIYLS